MSDGYAPFPMFEMQMMATREDAMADMYAFMGDDITAEFRARATACRDAIASYKALNERCLRAELALNHGIKEPAS